MGVGDRMKVNEVRFLILSFRMHVGSTTMHLRSNAG